MAPGDDVVVSQSGDFAPARALLAKARLRGPSEALPSGWSWEAYASLGGAEKWKRTLRAGVTVDVPDIGLGLFGVTAPTAVVFGLRVLGPGGAEPLELEVPAFYVDELLLDTDVGFVANKSPSPGEVGVPHSATIDFDFLRFGFTSPLSSIRVAVDGVSVFPTAPSGYSYSVTAPFPGVYRFSITTPTLTSKQVVVVDVVSLLYEVEERYSFTAADTEPPVLLSALATGLRGVRLTFDEAVAAPSAADFAVARLSAPAVSVSVLSVSYGSTPDVVELGLSGEASPGASYRVSWSAEDESGNASSGEADFLGYRPPRPAARRFDMLSMMPAAVRLADATGDLANLFACFQEVLDLMLARVDAWTRILDFEVAEERFLDALLLQLGNPFSFELTELEKRRLLRVLVEVYRRKGTAPGIVSAVRLFVGLEVEVVGLNDDSEAWVLGEDELGEDTVLGPSALRDIYSFEVVVPRALTVTERERIAAIAEYMKPAHTHHVRTVEPAVPEVVDHVELGLSELGEEFILHH